MPNTFFDYLINFDIMLQTNHKFWSTATLSRACKTIIISRSHIIQQEWVSGLKRRPSNDQTQRSSKHLNDCEYSTIAELWGQSLIINDWSCQFQGAISNCQQQTFIPLFSLLISPFPCQSACFRDQIFSIGKSLETEKSWHRKVTLCSVDQLI